MVMCPRTPSITWSFGNSKLTQCRVLTNERATISALYASMCLLWLSVRRLYTNISLTHVLQCATRVVFNTSEWLCPITQTFPCSANLLQWWPPCSSLTSERKSIKLPLPLSSSSSEQRDVTGMFIRLTGWLIKMHTCSVFFHIKAPSLKQY